MNSLRLLGGRLLFAAIENGFMVTVPIGAEIDIRFVSKVGVEHGRGGMGSQMPDLNGVAIGSGAHRTGRSGCAAGPCDILNDE